MGVLMLRRFAYALCVTSVLGGVAPIASKAKRHTSNERESLGYFIRSTFRDRIEVKDSPSKKIIFPRRRPFELRRSEKPGSRSFLSWLNRLEAVQKPETSTEKKRREKRAKGCKKSSESCP